MRHFLHIIFLLVTVNVHAQISQEFVIASIGGYSSTSSGSTYYTVGEMSMITTFSNSNNYLTQGFLQGSSSSFGHVNNPLPITLIDFSGFYSDGIDHLLWATATELDNDHFNVQRLDSKGEFRNIGTVKGAGNSNTERKYSLDDNAPLSGVNYYRLEQVDVDGKFTYSDVIAITTPVTTDLIVSMYPNPAQNYVNLSFISLDNYAGTLSLTDMMGNILYQIDLTGPSGTNIRRLDISGYENGSYLIKFTTSTTSTTYKVVKQF